MLLDELIKKYSYKLPEETVCGVYLSGYDFDILKEYLNKPFDGVFLSLMQTTVEEVASSIPGCNKFLTFDDKVIYLLDIDDCNSDLQNIISLSASKMTLTFYEKLYGFIYDYQETANNQEMSENDRNIINNRIENLYKILDADPIFIGTAFHIPSSIETEFIESVSVLAQKNAMNSIKELSDLIPDAEAYAKDCPKEVIYGLGKEKNVADAWIDIHLDIMVEGDQDD